MHLLAGCDALRSTHMLPEVLERPLSLDYTTPKNLTFVKLFLINILNNFVNDVFASKNTQRLGKISDVFTSKNTLGVDPFSSTRRTVCKGKCT